MGKIIHTRDRKRNKSPLENATEHPLGNATGNSVLTLFCSITVGEMIVKSPHRLYVAAPQRDWLPLLAKIESQ